MNRMAIVLALILVQAPCTAGTKVTGYSATSGSLRNEVLARISQIEKAQNNCADLTTVSSDDPALPAFMKGANVREFSTGPSKEIWTVTACGIQHKYSVDLLGDHGNMQLQNVQAIAP